eukprot:6866824-Lingulodinium_polyedra.AAC.1
MMRRATSSTETALPSDYAASSRRAWPAGRWPRSPTPHSGPSRMGTRGSARPWTPTCPRGKK